MWTPLVIFIGRCVFDHAHFTPTQVSLVGRQLPEAVITTFRTSVGSDALMYMEAISMDVSVSGSHIPSPPPLLVTMAFPSPLIFLSASSYCPQEVFSREHAKKRQDLNVWLGRAGGFFMIFVAMWFSSHYLIKTRKSFVYTQNFLQCIGV